VLCRVCVCVCFVFCVCVYVYMYVCLCMCVCHVACVQYEYVGFCFINTWCVQLIGNPILERSLSLLPLTLCTFTDGNVMMQFV